MTKMKKNRNDRNNLIQRFTKQKRRNILAEPGPRELIIVLDGLKPNFNIGKIFRSGYAFGIRRIHLIGIEFFDPAPAKGAFRYVPALFDDHFEITQKTLVEEGYEIFVFTSEGGESLDKCRLPEKSAFVFGHEEFGFSFPLQEYPDLHQICIQQSGKLDSLNVSVAASIAMYEYARQHTLERKKA